MRSPYRQEPKNQSPVNSFVKATGKKVAADLIGETSPLGSKLVGLASKAQSAATDAVDFGISSTGKLLGKAGGGLASILMDPTEIANDPMEGAYGAMLDNERQYHNNAIDRGDQMGPPVPAGDIRRIVDAEIDAPRIAKAKREAYLANSNQKPGFNFATLAGLLSSPYLGIR